MASLSERLGHLTRKALYVDDGVKSWPKDDLEAYLEDMAGQVTIMPNNEASEKQLQKTPQMTFHDGQPVKLLESGGVQFMLKEDMCDESVRYLSFLKRQWPQTPPVSPSILAKAGFFYIGVEDTVQCFSCNGRITNWTPGDTAMGDHRKFYPSCKFVRGIDDRNVPFTGLVDTSLKEATEKSIEDMVRSLRLEESEIVKPLPSTSSYFKKELNRLLTFKAWPISSPVDRFDLAAAGFYCVSESPGIVQCFACFQRLSNWKLGDRPKVKHRQKCPSCPFMLGHATGNDPLTQSQKENAGKYFSRGDANLKQLTQITANLPASGEYSSVARPLTSHDSDDLAVKYAKYPQHAHDQARLETYSQWPKNHSQVPANLVRAGFFATGNEDEVRCFYCGGGLKDWNIEDDPWEEHARWFSKCKWLIEQRGLSFVEAVIRKYGRSEPYYQPVPAPAPEPAESPHKFTVSSVALEPEPRSPQRKNSDAKQSEPKERVTKKQADTKNRQPEKKLGKKKDEEKRREMALIRKIADCHVGLEVGQNEAILRLIIRKWLQSGRNPEELLAILFAEEELQEKEASNQG